ACLAAVIAACAFAAAAAAPAPARASDVDSEHLFGFSEGADVGKKGERELESETIARGGKAAGQCGAITDTLEAKYVAAEGLRFGALAAFAYFGISGVPALPDRGDGVMQGVSFEARYSLLDRAHAPGAKLWRPVDAGTGPRTRRRTIVRRVQ